LSNKNCSKFISGRDDWEIRNYSTDIIFPGFSFDRNFSSGPSGSPVKKEK